MLPVIWDETVQHLRGNICLSSGDEGRTDNWLSKQSGLQLQEFRYVELCNLDLFSTIIYSKVQKSI
jgi:hypothetical protein